MILFKTVRWKNFLSTGNQFTEVFLNKSSTTLIVGENGSGKSTILDALCFALFNKPFRNINKPQLINSINGKNCLVEVEFSIGKKEYKIVRGAKPTKFEIYLNDEMINQDAASRDYQKYLEEHLLKLNFKSFTQIVILGSASFTPFMQLTSNARREIIEDLLDIKVFSTMNEVLKEKVSDAKQKIADAENKIDLAKNKAEIQQEYIEKLQSDKQKKVDVLKIQIKEIEDKIIALGDEIQDHTKIIDAKVNEMDDYDSIKKKQTKLTNLKDKLLDRIKKAKNEIKFFEENDTCPTCDQSITGSVKTNHIERESSKVLEIEAALVEVDLQTKQIQETIDAILKVQGEISEIQKTITELNNEVTVNMKLIQKLRKEIDDSSLDNVDIGKEKAKLREIAKEVMEYTQDKIALQDEKYYLDVASILLKDTGIKTKIIKQYLPVMNKIINKYLQAMDFFVSFELDESFSETIRSRHRDDFSYASFSEGEKQRIDLALMMAWRSIAKTKNSTNTNLLILDEVFDSSMDANGTDLLYQILGTLDSKTNVFIISHRDALFDKFRSVIKFQKINNFSQIAR
jgi:DNA repair exonuclease SbcCD ATPase subunit